FDRKAHPKASSFRSGTNSSHLLCSSAESPTSRSRGIRLVGFAAEPLRNIPIGEPTKISINGAIIHNDHLALPSAPGVASRTRRRRAHQDTSCRCQSSIEERIFRELSTPRHSGPTLAESRGRG